MDQMGWPYDSLGFPLFVSYLANLPWTPYISTDSESPIKCILWGLIRGAPDSLNTPFMGAEVFSLGLRLMEHSDHQRVKQILGSP